MSAGKQEREREEGRERQKAEGEVKDKSVGVGRCQHGEIMLFSDSCVGGTGKNVITAQLKI